MAMIDYGAIAFKNSKLISTDMFTPMIDMVDWEDTETDTHHNHFTNTDEPLKLKDNYFAYIGDRNCTIAFYKCQIVIVSRWDNNRFMYEHEYFNSTRYTWSKWTNYVGTHKVIVTKRNGYYVCKWKHKGDKYKVYFGYGVDLPYYKRWYMVNYYRSFSYRLYEVKRWLKDMMIDWKYRH